MHVFDVVEREAECARGEVAGNRDWPAVHDQPLAAGVSDDPDGVKVPVAKVRERTTQGNQLSVPLADPGVFAGQTFRPIEPALRECLGRLRIRNLVRIPSELTELASSPFAHLTGELRFLVGGEIAERGARRPLLTLKQ